MLKQAIAWFPEEREFLKIGIEKASADGKRDIREELLGIAIERFFDDMYFLRESTSSSSRNVTPEAWQEWSGR